MIHRYPIRSSPISKRHSSFQHWDWLCLLKSWEMQSTVSRRGLTISYRLAWNLDRRASPRVRALLRKPMFYWVNLSKSLDSGTRGANIFSFSVAWLIILRIGHMKAVKTVKTQTCRSRKIRKILTSTFVWKGSKAKKSIEERAFAS